MPAIVARLEDPEDDVKGTAAAALLPVAQCMAEIVPADVSNTYLFMPSDVGVHVSAVNEKETSCIIHRKFAFCTLSLIKRIFHLCLEVSLRVCVRTYVHTYLPLCRL